VIVTTKCICETAFSGFEPAALEEAERRKAASMLHLTVWVAAIILQSALLGRNMYAVSDAFCKRSDAHVLQLVATAQLIGMFVCFQLVCLTDLENDFINPFDLSSKMNRFVVSEIVKATYGTAQQLQGGTHGNVCHSGCARW
jgi:hypothetical protein